MKYWLLIVPLLCTAQMWPNPGPGHASYGGGGAPVKQVFVGGSTTVLTAETSANAVFMYPLGVDGDDVPTTTEANFQNIFLAGTISDLRCESGATMTTGTMFIIPTKCTGLAAGGGPCIDQTLSCDITGGTLDSDLVNSFHVDNGDRVSMKMYTTTGATDRNITWSFKWTSDNNDESMIVVRALPVLNTNTSCTGLVAGSPSIATTCTNTGMGANLAIVPDTGFTATKLYARALDPVTGTTCRRVEFAKNGIADTSCGGTACFRADLVDGATVVDTSGSVLLNTAFDNAAISVDPSGAGLACGSTGTAAGGTIVSVTVGLSHAAQHFMTAACGGNCLAGATRHMRQQGGGVTCAAALPNMNLPAMTITNSVLSIGADPTGAETWTYNVLNAGSPIGAATCVITGGGSKQCTQSAFSSVVSAGTSIANQLIPSAGAAATSTSCASIGGF